MDWTNWVLGVTASVVAMTIGGMAALVMNHEKRLAGIEKGQRDMERTLARLEDKVMTLETHASSILVAVARVETIMQERLK